MFIGDGGSYFYNLGSIDVIGHEMSHGVTADTADLVYSGESGGLNESHSDIGGEMVEAYARAGGTGAVVPDKGNSLNKCTDIINGLSSSLDFDHGGEVVENLGRLYDYCASRLYTAGVSLDPAVIDEVTTLLTTIKKGWLGVQAKNG